MEFSVLNAAKAPGLPDAVRRGNVPVGDEGDPLPGQGVHGVLLHAGPAEGDLRPGICQLGPQGEGVDAGGNAEDWAAGHVPDAAAAAQSPGDGPGDILRLIDAAVIGTDPGVGHGDGAVQNTDLRVLRRRLPAGPDEGRRDGEEDLGPVLNGLLHGGLRLLPGAEAVEDLRFHPVLQHGFQVLPPQVVGPGPVALLRQLVADEGHMQAA